jgi:hypothetical protein
VKKQVTRFQNTAGFLKVSITGIADGAGVL